MSEGNNEKARAEAMDRLLAGTLRQTERAGGTDCPEPDILAAYSERTLSDREVRDWEKHFSQCSRCQQTLAALALSQAEAALAARERVAGAAATTSERRRRRKTVWPTWRWLAPAAAVAAAAAIWIVGKPASLWKPAPTRMAQRQPSGLPASAPPAAPPSSEERRPDTLSETEQTRGRSSSGEDGIARKPSPDLGAKLGASGSERPSVSVRRELAAESDRARREDSSRSGGPVPENPPSGAAGTVPGGVPGLATGKSSRADGRFKEKKIEPSAEELPQEQEKQSQPRQATKDVERFAKTNPTTPSPEAADHAEVLGNRSHLAERKLGVRPTGGLNATRSDELRGRLKMMETVVIPQLISPPTGSLRWRIGAAGSIERSTDGGASWQLQTSGVTTDLSAGSAPSESVCWVVGRSGAILRTTDGEHWEKIASPAALDWTRVTAQDALHAGVSARDDRPSRLFVTRDGGKTWQVILR